MLLEAIVCGETDLDFVHLNRFLEFIFVVKPIFQADLWHANILVYHRIIVGSDNTLQHCF